MHCSPFYRNSSDRLHPTSYTGTNIIFIEKRKSFPASLENARHFLISRSDLQCFSHEEGCFEPVKRTLRAACLNYSLESDFRKQMYDDPVLLGVNYEDTVVDDRNEDLTAGVLFDDVDIICTRDQNVFNYAEL